MSLQLVRKRQSRRITANRVWDRESEVGNEIRFGVEIFEIRRENFLFLLFFLRRSLGAALNHDTMIRFFFFPGHSDFVVPHTQFLTLKPVNKTHTHSFRPVNPKIARCKEDVTGDGRTGGGRAEGERGRDGRLREAALVIVRTADHLVNLAWPPTVSPGSMCSVLCTETLQAVTALD